MSAITIVHPAYVARLTVIEVYAYASNLGRIIVNKRFKSGNYLCLMSDAQYIRMVQETRERVARNLNLP